MKITTYPHSAIRAFSLIELLVTSSIMVVVGVLTVATFSSIARVQVEKRVSQSVSNQLTTGMALIKSDMQSVPRVTAAQIAIAPIASTASQSSLFMVVNKRSEDGSLSSQKQIVNYCVKTQVIGANTIGTLVRISADVATNYDLSLVTLPGNCSEGNFVGASVRDVFEVDTETMLFEASPTYVETVAIGSVFTSLRVTLSSRYNPVKKDSGADSSLTGLPITLRNQISNLLP